MAEPYMLGYPRLLTTLSVGPNVTNEQTWTFHGRKHKSGRALGRRRVGDDDE